MNMRTSEDQQGFSITMPLVLAKQAERLAQKENRSISELMREAFRRYQQPAGAADVRKYVRMIAPLIRRCAPFGKRPSARALTS
jgi:hypothetical protein